MEKTPEIPRTHIEFRNEPRRNAWADEQENEALNATPPAISHLLATNPLFQGRRVAVEYFQDGISSVACLLTSDNKKWVLKMPLSPDGTSTEGVFLKAWESIGIPVPHVEDEGQSLGRTYTLMNYIDAQPLIKLFTGDEMVDRGMFFRMGNILRKMHTVPAEGYGRFENGKGQHETFQEWLAQQEQRIAYVKEHQMLNEAEHGSIDMALDVLSRYVIGTSSSYCHYDFSASHVFNTEPLTVFDPEPNVNHPVIDLARSIVLIAGTKPPVDIQKTSQQLVDGYVGSNAPFDQRILRSGVLLQTYLKFRFWDKTGQDQKIQYLQDYLAATK